MELYVFLGELAHIQRIVRVFQLLAVHSQNIDNASVCFTSFINEIAMYIIFPEGDRAQWKVAEWGNLTCMKYENSVWSRICVMVQYFFYRSYSFLFRL